MTASLVVQVDALLFSRRNEDVRPFEPGGEVSLEFFADKSDCGLFCLGSHSKKRPHNITLGRFFDRRLLDLIEFGVDSFRALKAFGAAGTAVQTGNKVRSGEALKLGGVCATCFVSLECRLLVYLLLNLCLLKWTVLLALHATLLFMCVGDIWPVIVCRN